MTSRLTPLNEIALHVPGYVASAIGNGSWAVNNGQQGGPIVILDSDLRELYRLKAPKARYLGFSEPFVTASLESMKAAWLSWPDLYLCDLGDQLQPAFRFGEGNSYTGSDCAFSSDGRSLYFVVPAGDEDPEDCRLFELDVASSNLVDLGAVPASEGGFHVKPLASGSVFVTVAMAQNGGATWCWSAESRTVLGFGPDDWMFDVSADEALALGGCGDLSIYGWPSGSSCGEATIPGTVVAACFLDEENAVVVSTEDGAALVPLDTLEAGPLIPFGDGDSWCLAHQHGVALVRIGTNRLASYDLNQLRPHRQQ